MIEFVVAQTALLVNELVPKGPSSAILPGRTRSCLGASPLPRLQDDPASQMCSETTSVSSSGLSTGASKCPFQPTELTFLLKPGVKHWLILSCLYHALS